MGFGFISALPFDGIANARARCGSRANKDCSESTTGESKRHRRTEVSQCGKRSVLNELSTMSAFLVHRHPGQYGRCASKKALSSSFHQNAVCTIAVLNPQSWRNGSVQWIEKRCPDRAVNWVFERYCWLGCVGNRARHSHTWQIVNRSASEPGCQSALSRSPIAHSNLKHKQAMKYSRPPTACAKHEIATGIVETQQISSVQSHRR